jgi:soluble lytic murein transglycosylase
MPATGEHIAGRLGDEDYERAGLYEPHRSLRFGAWYLAQQLDAFDGEALVALAAYNGGPGNARRWLEAAGGDADLFAELIDFRETRSYVRLVTEQRAQYERLYAR